MNNNHFKILSILIRLKKDIQCLLSDDEINLIYSNNKILKTFNRYEFHEKTRLKSIELIRIKKSIIENERILKDLKISDNQKIRRIKKI